MWVAQQGRGSAKTSRAGTSFFPSALLLVTVALSWLQMQKKDAKASCILHSLMQFLKTFLTVIELNIAVQKVLLKKDRSIRL